ncbi:MAG: alkaline phosphatase D family protein [Pseudomonadota bacterium]
MADFSSFSRRRLLQLAAAVSSGLVLPSGAQPRLADNPFALGVASGSPAHDSVVLWTRLVGAGAQALEGGDVGLRWELAHDEGFARIAQRGEARAVAALAHSVHVEVTGLEPERGYFYRFIAGGWTSPAGRTRTFPAADAMPQRLRLAYASCQRWEHGYFSAYRQMRRDAPDAVLFLGDYIYEYPTATNPVRSPGDNWVLTLDGYRRRYALYKTDPDLQAMHHACPWLFTWDDHEVQNDYAGLQAGNSGPEVADFAARRAAAYQACYEHMPLRASVLTRALAGLAGGAEMRIYTRQAYGRLARLVLLDARQYRDPQACTRGGKLGSGTLDPAGCAAWNDPRRTMLGAAQEQWLDAQLAAPAPGWTVLGQSTLFGQRDFKPGPGQSLWNDGWDGYAAARGRFAQSLQRHRVADAVLLGGDVHENWVGHVKADYDKPESAALGVEFCGTSISSRSSAPERIGERMADNPHFIFADGFKRGYGIAEFTPKQLTVDLRAVDDVVRADSGVSTLARFAVQAGRPVVERA